MFGKREMVGKGGGDLEFCFERLVMGGDGRGRMEAGVITEWKDIPMELLLRIVSLVDDRTVIMASGVCSGWRDAICLGLISPFLGNCFFCPMIIYSCGFPFLDPCFEKLCI